MLVGDADALRSLAVAARAVTAAATDDDVLDIVADAARSVIGTSYGSARRGVEDDPPPGPRLAAPLLARDGSSLGLIELSDKLDGSAFTEADEAILVQLAQMAANAIETIELLAREHAARVEAEETGRRLLHEKQRAEALQRVGSALAARLELREIVELATDAARELTPAEYGAFAYDDGEYFSPAGSEPFPLPEGPLTDIARHDDGAGPARSFLAVPVVASTGVVLGGLFFGHPEAGMFSDEDERMVAGIAAQAAIAIENARLYQERTRTALTLQRALLPPSLPEPDGLLFAAGYRAAGEGNEVGGDFYDVFEQSDGSFAVVVGDVCGKGPQAAAVTALARYTLRAHAAAALSPSFLLMRLNEALLRQRAPGFVTVAVARVELTPSGARMEVTAAGHPSPILARDGRAAPVGEIGTPLGLVVDPDLPQSAIDLVPGDVVAFYTDGVTESAAPRVLLDESDLAGLIAERAPSGPAAVVERLEHTAVALAEGAPRDDIAALALMLPRSGPAVAREFDATPQAARDVADVLAPLGADLGTELAADLRLLATELVANAVRHTGVADGSLELRVRMTGDVVHLSVADDGPGFEVPERPLIAPEGPGGWGLYLVDQCAARWGTERGDRHLVWFELERRNAA
jgi:serine phosphatase RsbU (regulator of sigma subunit)/anti-sigma regulatory factor (Ser/Thr protein kinase)